VLNATLSQFGTNANCSALHLRKDEPIYFEGDPARTWFVVESGVARTCRFHADGHRQLTGFHFERDVFGLDDDVRLESAEAVTDLFCWCFSTHAGAANTGPEARDVLKKALDNANRCIFLFGRRTAHERIAAFLLMLAERQHARERVELPMSRNDIADYLGLTMHTVSRTISQLCQEGLILLDGPHHCRITNEPGLQGLAGENGQPRLGDGELIPNTG
jgi:CRP/FNR family transcriptional regulator/CRP/FNR family nitrogen fixation transcriptional regulator